MLNTENSIELELIIVVVHVKSIPWIKKDGNIILDTVLNIGVHVNNFLIKLSSFDSQTM